MIKKSVKNKIVILEFNTRKEQGLSMCRISEFYEGKTGFIGKYFDFDTFLDKYSDSKGNIDYFSFWDGFNIIGKSILDFSIKFAGKLTKRETQVLKCIKTNTEYLITYTKGDIITLRHELAHALFSTNERYRKAVLETLKEIDPKLKNKFETGLYKLNYNKKVYLDEINAYIVAANKKELNKEFKISMQEIKQIKAKLNKLYEKFI